MNNEVSGKLNRAAGRDFHEGNVKVDQLIGRDVVNIVVPGSKESESEPLVVAQRKQLNQLAKDVAEASNEEGYIVWQRVHAVVGVNSINEITKEQFPTAIELLQNELAKLQDASSCKALMHQILKKSSDDEVKQTLYQYCDISFGSRRLNSLTKAQLQQALGWLCNEQNIAEKAATPVPPERLSVFDLLRSYPKELGCILLAGILLGAVLFK